MPKVYTYKDWVKWKQAVRNGRYDVAPGVPDVDEDIDWPALSEDELLTWWSRLTRPERISQECHEWISRYHETGKGNLTGTGTWTDDTWPGMSDLQLVEHWETTRAALKKVGRGRNLSASQVYLMDLRAKKLAEQQKQRAVRKVAKDVARMERRLKSERRHT